jgi:menaquinone-dependent protoporphyrinogen oxidase
MAEPLLAPSPSSAHRGPARRVLVAYATKRGSTREVADAIATTLQEQGHRVDLRAAGDCSDLSEYRGVVLGGSLYMGRWHRDARDFLKRHAAALETRHVAIFAMGPQKMDDKSVRSARQQLDRALERAPDLDPLDVAIFGGVIDPAKLRFPFNRMQPSDARDWDAIRAWATDLATRLSSRDAPSDKRGSR